VERYRITTTPPGEAEQTWVLLPDQASAHMQAEELANREKRLHVRVYHEKSDAPREISLDLPPRIATQ
jgi:hypothetical protein